MCYTFICFDELNKNNNCDSNLIQENFFSPEPYHSWENLNLCTYFIIGYDRVINKILSTIKYNKLG